VFLISQAKFVRCRLIFLFVGRMRWQAESLGEIRGDENHVVTNLSSLCKIDLIKLMRRCRGPIVHTSKRLGEVRRIIGECIVILTRYSTASPVDGVTYSPGSLRAAMKNRLRVAMHPTDNGLGLFFAEAGFSFDTNHRDT